MSTVTNGSFAVKIHAVDAKHPPTHFVRDGGEYIALDSGDKYHFELINNWSERVDVEVFKDGEFYDGYQLRKNSRWLVQDRELVFTVEDSKMAEAAGAVKGDKNYGLIKAIFTPEKKQEPRKEELSFFGSTEECCDGDERCSARSSSSSSSSSLSSLGGRGWGASTASYKSGLTLVGKELNKYNKVGAIVDTDLDRRTVVLFRMVARDAETEARYKTMKAFVEDRDAGKPTKSMVDPPRIEKTD